MSADGVAVRLRTIRAAVGRSRAAVAAVKGACDAGAGAPANSGVTNGSMPSLSQPVPTGHLTSSTIDAPADSGMPSTAVTDAVVPSSAVAIEATGQRSGESTSKLRLIAASAGVADCASVGMVWQPQVGGKGTLYMGNARSATDKGLCRRLGVVRTIDCMQLEQLVAVSVAKQGSATAITAFISPLREACFRDIASGKSVLLHPGQANNQDEQDGIAAVIAMATVIIVMAERISVVAAAETVAAAIRPQWSSHLGSNCRGLLKVLSELDAALTVSCSTEQLIAWCGAGGNTKSARRDALALRYAELSELRLVEKVMLKHPLPKLARRYFKSLPIGTIATIYGGCLRDSEHGLDPTNYDIRIWIADNADLCEACADFCKYMRTTHGADCGQVTSGPGPGQSRCSIILWDKVLRTSWSRVPQTKLKRPDVSIRLAKTMALAADAGVASAALDNSLTAWAHPQFCRDRDMGTVTVFPPWRDPETHPIEYGKKCAQRTGGRLVIDDRTFWAGGWDAWITLTHSDAGSTCEKTRDIVSNSKRELKLATATVNAVASAVAAAAITTAISALAKSTI